MIKNMKQSCLQPLLALFLMLALGLAGLSCSRDDTPAPVAIPRPTPPTNVTVEVVTPQVVETRQTIPVDLAGFYDPQLPASDATGIGPALPRGPQMLGGVSFDIGGVIRLARGESAAEGKVFREHVKGIPINRRFERLHLLHGVAGNTTNGQPVVHLIVNYEDGLDVDFAILYGEHVRDWLKPDDESAPEAEDSNSQVVWRGNPTAANAPSRTLRLYKTTFVNPFPDREIQNLDLVSAKSPAAPVILAISGGTSRNVSDEDSLANRQGPIEALTGRFLFQAVDATNNLPIEKMKIKVTGSEGQNSFSLGTWFTDVEGKCAIRCPDETLNYLNLVINRDGYVPKSIRWDKRRNTERIPTTYTLRAEPALTIGGFVRNEAGEPIEGARLNLQGYTSENGSSGLEQLALSSVTARSDAEGRWLFHCLPRNLSEFNLALEHSNYSRAFFACNNRSRAAASTRVTLKELLATNAILVMKSGLVLSGRVTDEQDKPIVGARVMLGENRYARGSSPNRTDREGRFRFHGLTPGPSYLTVQANGFAPDLKEITVATNTAPVLFKLAKGKVLKGRVVDGAGLPVAEARLSAQSWRGRQTLDWGRKTDGDGRFYWDSAPADAIDTYLYKEGFMQQENLSLIADGQEHVFTLKESPMISGKVIDAESKLPIEKFTIVTGQNYGGDQVNWQRYRAAEGRDGTFSMTMQDYGSRCMLRIEAPGYLPAVSKPFKLEDAGQPFEFELKKGFGPRGVVLSASGAPAAGAEVAQLTRDNYLNLGKGRFTSYNSRDTSIVKADAQGRFSLPADPDAQAILAVNKQGFAEVSLEAFASTTNLTLQPWGRIEGVLRVGSRPGTNLSLIIGPNNAGTYRLNFDFEEYKATTDEEGRFVFDGVPPGERALYRLVPLGPNSQGWSHQTPVLVKPGETIRLTMGGTGRPIVGRAVLSTSGRSVDWQQGHSSLNTKFPQPPRPFNSQEEAMAWQNTPEFKAAQKQQRSYSLMFSTDGSFRADDIPAGNYDLNISLLEQIENGRGQRFIGSHNQEIIVPEIPGGRSDEPLDVGTIEVRLQR